MSLDHLKAFNPKQHVPAFNSPHECPMCGCATTWEKRQEYAQRMRIYGRSVKEILDIIGFAEENGYKPR